MSELIHRVLESRPDRFSFELPLAGGGIAAVYLALGRKHDRRVALKVFGSALTSALDAQRFGLRCAK